MGASASLQRKVYKFMECGCIYCYDFSNENPETMQMLCHCYNCFQKLKKKEFEISLLKDLIHELSYFNKMDELICDKNNGWMNQSQAIQEAKRRNMRGIDEFILNTNILEKYDIQYKSCVSKK